MTVRHSALMQSVLRAEVFSGHQGIKKSFVVPFWGNLKVSGPVEMEVENPPRCLTSCTLRLPLQKLSLKCSREGYLAEVIFKLTLIHRSQTHRGYVSGNVRPIEAQESGAFILPKAFI